MDNRKIKVTIEENGKTVEVLEGGAVQICLLQESCSANFLYGSMNTIDAACIIHGMHQQEERLKGKYDKFAVEMLLAIIEKEANNKGMECKTDGSMD